MPSLNSSNISSAEYDDETGVMTITFASGSTYSYSGVPKSTYEALCSSPSPGSFFARQIRNQYAATRES